jgi:hypothetical protein
VYVCFNPVVTLSCLGAHAPRNRARALQALVVSEETASGAGVVNERRVSLGLPPLVAVVIPLEADHHQQHQQQQQQPQQQQQSSGGGKAASAGGGKVSSSGVREWLEVRTRT